MSNNEFSTDDLEFELSFFNYIAGSSNYEIIPIPDLDGSVPSEDDFRFMAEECKRRGIKLLYRISAGTHAIVYSVDLDKIAIVPEDNPHGFHC